MFKELTKFIFYYLFLFLAMAAVYLAITQQQSAAIYVSLSAISLLSSAMPYIKFYIVNGPGIKLEVLRFSLFFLTGYSISAVIYNATSSSQQAIAFIMISLVLGILSVSPYIRFFTKSKCKPSV